MADNFNYKFSPKAIQDLDEILSYIQTELANPKASKDFAIKIFDAIDVATAFPESGMKTDNEYMPDQSLRYLLVNNYKVFYKHDKEAKLLIIIRIVYGKMNMDKIFRNL